MQLGLHQQAESSMAQLMLHVTCYMLHVTCYMPIPAQMPARVAHLASSLMKVQNCKHVAAMLARAGDYWSCLQVVLMIFCFCVVT